MPEKPPMNLEKPKEFDPKGLNFDELKAAYELAHTTFKMREDGFESVDGDIILIKQINDRYRIAELPASDRRQNLQRELFHGENSELFRKGTLDKAAIMSAMKKALEKIGNQIIE